MIAFIDDHRAVGEGVRGIEGVTRRATLAMFRQTFGPQHFRHALATSMATEDPAHAGAVALLGHSAAVLEKHYNRADQAAAAVLEIGDRDVRQLGAPERPGKALDPSRPGTAAPGPGSRAMPDPSPPCAAGTAIDPWHLAALLEGLRLRLDGGPRIIDRGLVFAAARHALDLHRWLVVPDGAQEGEIRRRGGAGRGDRRVEWETSARPGPRLAGQGP